MCLKLKTLAHEYDDNTIITENIAETNVFIVNANADVYNLVIYVYFLQYLMYFILYYFNFKNKNNGL